MVGTRARAFSPATLLVRRPRGRTHARTTSYPPSLLGYQVAVLYVGDFFSPSLPRPSRSPIPVSRLGHMARDEGYEREAGRKVMGRETVGLCFAKSACCSQGTYRYARLCSGSSYESAAKSYLQEKPCRCGPVFECEQVTPFV